MPSLKLVALMLYPSLLIPCPSRYNTRIHSYYRPKDEVFRFLFDKEIIVFVCFFFGWQRNVREIAELYGCENSLEAVEEHRRLLGLESSGLKCFESARISAVLIDDGLKLDKTYDIEWHKRLVPFVGRILRIERLAEQILDDVRGFSLKIFSFELNVENCIYVVIFCSLNGLLELWLLCFLF